MDVYQNLISGDKWSGMVQGNSSGWLLPWYDYTQKQANNQDVFSDLVSNNY